MGAAAGFYAFAEPSDDPADERHHGQANVAFCDGHVEAMTVTELGYEKNADGSVAFNGAETRNALFSGTRRDDDPPDTN